MARAFITNARGMAIGTLSRQTGVNIETIRYYERIGLLEPPGRTPAGRRNYDPAQARRLSFVRLARQLGFSLGEVRELLALAAPGRRDCGAVGRVAGCQLDAVRERIRDLRRLEAILANTVARCRAGQVGDCAVLDMLENPGRG